MARNNKVIALIVGIAVLVLMAIALIVIFTGGDDKEANKTEVDVKVETKAS
jgi:hypothetical protein